MKVRWNGGDHIQTVLLEVWLMLQQQTLPSSSSVVFWDPDCSWQISTSGVLCPPGKLKNQQGNRLATRWPANNPGFKKLKLIGEYTQYKEITNVEIFFITPCPWQMFGVKEQESTYSFESVLRSWSIVDDIHNPSLIHFNFGQYVNRSIAYQIITFTTVKRAFLSR